LYRPGSQGMLPIHMAAMNGFLDCFKKLVALMPNLNVDCVDELGRTCLHAAACGGSALGISVTFLLTLLARSQNERMLVYFGETFFCSLGFYRI